MNFKKITTIYLVIIPDSTMKKSNQIKGYNKNLKVR